MLVKCNDTLYILDSLITISPEKYAVGQIGETLTISCLSSYGNDKLQWFQGPTTGNGVQTTTEFFSSDPTVIFTVTRSYLNSTFYCTFEDHPIYYNVFTEFVLLESKFKFA